MTNISKKAARRLLKEQKRLMRDQRIKAEEKKIKEDNSITNKIKRFFFKE